MKSKLRIAFMVNSKHYIPHAKVLVTSLRMTGEEFENLEVMAMILNNDTEIETGLKEEVNDPNFRVEYFSLDGVSDSFPFKDKVYAAASAEALSEDVDSLVWMDCDMFFVNAPRIFYLDRNNTFGYRPVDKKLIGSEYAKEADSFWSRLYSLLSLKDERIFSITTSVDRQVIRAYFNAGLMILNPKKAILRQWKKNFDAIYLRPFFMDYYKQNSLYAIFVHQAVLAATVLSATDKKELVELSYLTNYPLHLHKQYPEDKKPKSLRDVTCCRYDTFFEEGKIEEIDLPEPLKQLLRDNSHRLLMEWKYNL